MNLCTSGFEWMLPKSSRIMLLHSETDAAVLVFSIMCSSQQQQLLLWMVCLWRVGDVLLEIKINVKLTAACAVCLHLTAWKKLSQRNFYQNTISVAYQWCWRGTNATFKRAQNNMRLESIDWSIDWLIDWLTDRLIDWLIDWLINWLADWLIDWSINWFTDWLTDYLIGWPINWLTDRPTTVMEIILVYYYSLFLYFLFSL